MRMLLIGCITLLGLVLLKSQELNGQEGRGDEITKERVAKGDKHEQIQERLNGQWKIVAGVIQGKKLGQDHLSGSQVIIKDGIIVVLDPDENEMYKGKYKLDISTSPYQIDMTSDLPTLPKTIALGIFEFRAEGWRLCYGLPGAGRPEKFAAPEGSHVMLFSLGKAGSKDNPKGELKNPNPESASLDAVK